MPARPGRVTSRPGRMVSGVVSLSDVEDMIAALPEVTVGSKYGNNTWMVGGKGFAWERPFSKADIKRFADDPVPDGPILAVRVDDLGEKEAVLAMGQKGFFTIPHFNGYAAVLIQLKLATKKSVRVALEDGWLACAPRGLAESYLAGRRTRSS